MSRSDGEVSQMSPIQMRRRTAAMASVKVKALLRYQAAAQGAAPCRSRSSATG